MNISKGFTKKTLTLAAAAVSVLSIVVFPLLATAATLTTPRMYMNRQKANQSTGQTFQIFLTPATNVSGGAGANEVRIIFPDGDDTEWCRTAGSLTVTGIANPEGATESATSLPGTLAGTCAQGSGSGGAESNSDRLLITGVDNLTASTKYGVQVVANTAALGTATPAANDIKVTVKTRDNSTEIDSGTLAVSLISDDQVVVSAVVDVTLSVALNTTSLSLGTLSASVNSYVGVVSTVSTSAASGYISLVKFDQTLTSGGDNIPVIGSSPPDNMQRGTLSATSAFGASTSDTGNTIDQWDSDTSGCNGTVQTTANDVSAEALTTTFQSWASSATGVSGEANTLCYLATISSTQAPGTYTSTSTLVTTGRF